MTSLELFTINNYSSNSTTCSLSLSFLVFPFYLSTFFFLLTSFYMTNFDHFLLPSFLDVIVSDFQSWCDEFLSWNKGFISLLFLSLSSIFFSPGLSPPPCPLFSSKQKKLFSSLVGREWSEEKIIKANACKIKIERKKEKERLLYFLPRKKEESRLSCLIHSLANLNGWPTHPPLFFSFSCLLSLLFSLFVPLSHFLSFSLCLSFFLLNLCCPCLEWEGWLLWRAQGHDWLIHSFTHSQTHSLIHNTSSSLSLSRFLFLPSLHFLYYCCPSLWFSFIFTPCSLPFSLSLPTGTKITTKMRRIIYITMMMMRPSPGSLIVRETREIETDREREREKVESYVRLKRGELRERERKREIGVIREMREERKMNKKEESSYLWNESGVFFVSLTFSLFLYLCLSLSLSLANVCFLQFILFSVLN